MCCLAQILKFPQPHLQLATTTYSSIIITIILQSSNIAHNHHTKTWFLLTASFWSRCIGRYLNWFSRQIFTLHVELHFERLRWSHKKLVIFCLLLLTETYTLIITANVVNIFWFMACWYISWQVRACLFTSFFKSLQGCRMVPGRYGTTVRHIDIQRNKHEHIV